MKIGFIGLGIMGKPMAKNLLKAGYEVIGYDHHQENMDEIVAAGGTCRESVGAVAKDSEVIITMLPNGPHVKEAVMGPDGVLDHAAPGTVVIDMSSIAPLGSQEVCRACEEKGLKMLDAPVSGGEPKAIDGTLSIMVGGDKEVFDQMHDVLMSMGASVVHCGSIGAGNTTKLANQVIVAVNIAAMSEAFMLSTRAGVEPEKVFEAIKGGLAGSAILNAKLPAIIEDNFKPGFKLDLHIKDLNNALETGHGVGSPLPLTAQVMEMLQQMHADGYGMDDHSSLIKYYEKLTGTKVRK